MESILFALDIIGIVLLLYWSIRNDELAPDAPTVGLFAYRETLGARAEDPGKGPAEGPAEDPAEGPGRPGPRGRGPSLRDRDP